MKIDYYEFNLAGHWIPAIVNADHSGLTDEECADLAAFLNQFETGPHTWLDVIDEEPQFATDAVSGLLADVYECRLYFHVKEVLQ